jgi:hypothetical protein
MTFPGTPPSSAGAEFWKQVSDAAVELSKTQLADAYADSRAELIRQEAYDKALEEERAARRKAEWDTDLDVHKQVMTSMVELTKGSIDRSRDSAKFVQTVSAALATAYTAVLGFVFAVKDNPLPARGFIPTIFLGLSAALATAYLAYLTQNTGAKALPGAALPRENSLRKVAFLVDWTGSTVYQRAPLLRGSVIALLIAVGFLPIAVVNLDHPPTIPFLTAAASPTTSSSATTGPSSVSPTPGSTWPPPPSIVATEAMTVELYKAQLAAYADQLKAANATATVALPVAPDHEAEDFAWKLAILGFILVAFVSILPFARQWLKAHVRLTLR